MLKDKLAYVATVAAVGQLMNIKVRRIIGFQYDDKMKLFQDSGQCWDNPWKFHLLV